MLFYKFLLKWGKMKKILSPAYFLKLKNIILYLNRGSIFFQMVIFATLFRRCPTLFSSVWNTHCCFNVVERCKLQRWRTQRCFNLDLTLCGVATSYQPNNNVEPTLKCLLGKIWRHDNDREDQHHHLSYIKMLLNKYIQKISSSWL